MKEITCIVYKTAVAFRGYCAVRIHASIVEVLKGNTLKCFSDALHVVLLLASFVARKEIRAKAENRPAVQRFGNAATYGATILFCSDLQSEPFFAVTCCLMGHFC